MEISSPLPSVALSKSDVFLICCKLKTNFIAKSQLLYMGCPHRRERKQKKLQFSFSTVSASAYERVFAYGNEFDWGKTGIWKGVRKWSSPLTRVSVRRELTVSERLGQAKWIKGRASWTLCTSQMPERSSISPSVSSIWLFRNENFG